MASTPSGRASGASTQAAAPSALTQGDRLFVAKEEWMQLEEEGWSMHIYERNGWSLWPVIEIEMTTKARKRVKKDSTYRWTGQLLVDNHIFRCINQRVTVPPDSYERYVLLEPRQDGAVQTSWSNAPGVDQGGSGRLMPRSTSSVNPSAAYVSSARARGRRSQSVPPADRPVAPALAGRRSASTRSSGHTASPAGAPPRRGLSSICGLLCFNPLARRSRREGGPRFRM